MSQINWPAIGFTILPNVGGVAGGILARKNIENWYASLKKPEWRPPNAVFGPVWTSLYSSMGFASYMVYRDGQGFSENWYASLKKPQWTPPDAVFGPVWTSLYTGMGYASYMVYRDGQGFSGPARLPLIVYGSNILLNWTWTPIFFGAKNPKLALAEIQLVNLTALGTGYLFYKINPIAGYLIIPYCLWLGLATTLNYVIWRDNKDNKPKITELKEE